MDAITQGWLDGMSSRFPNYALHLSSQFLSIGDCGFVPNDWNGSIAHFDTNYGYKPYMANSKEN